MYRTPQQRSVHDAAWLAAIVLGFLRGFGLFFLAAGGMRLFCSARAAPKILRDFGGVDPDGSPPCALIAGVVNGAVVDATERDGELIADLAAKRARLHEAKMVRIRGFAGTYQAGLLMGNAYVDHGSL